MINPIKWVMDWWHERQRAIDISILWPQCKKTAFMHTDDEDSARLVAEAMFKEHVMMDPAWKDLSIDEIRRIFKGLP